MPIQMLLIPLDAFKIMMQVEGSSGVRMLLAKLKQHGIFALWDGATVAALSMIASHYPWYLSFNYLNGIMPAQVQPWRCVRCAVLLHSIHCLRTISSNLPFLMLIAYLLTLTELPTCRKLLRSAFIGFVCTGLGDLVSNTFKVH